MSGRLSPRRWLGIAWIVAVVTLVAVVFLLLALGMGGVQK